MSSLIKFLVFLFLILAAINLFVCVNLLFFQVNYSSTVLLENRLLNRENISSKAIILIWSGYYALGSQRILRNILPYKQRQLKCCREVLVTVDRTKLFEADVVVFHNYGSNLKFMPPRLPRQVWVLFGFESPIHSANLTHFSNVFNWTMTYRKDSDIWSPYGYTIKRERPLLAQKISVTPNKILLTKWIAQKSKIISAVLSKCSTPSKREIVIRKLNQYNVSVDIFGRCGIQPDCPLQSLEALNCTDDGFWRNMSAVYKFYFAAENSLCDEYISEKFWRALYHGLVPVVYGAAIYEEVAPPNSFIDYRNFSNVEGLANYLKWLSNNPEEYARYFEWRRDYDVVWTDTWHSWCELCDRAISYHSSPDTYPKKVYKDLQKWWWTKAEGGRKGSVCVSKI